MGLIDDYLGCRDIVRKWNIKKKPANYATAHTALQNLTTDVDQLIFREDKPRMACQRVVDITTFDES